MPTSVQRNSQARVSLMQYAFPPSYRPPQPLIGPWDLNACGSEITGSDSSNWSSRTYPTINLALGYMFTIAEKFLVAKVWWMNGTTVGTDSADVGVYTEAGVKLISGAGTVTAGANLVQEEDVTDTLIMPGRYWCVYNQSGVTSTPIAIGSSIGNLRAMGCAQFAGAVPLGSTFTPAAVAAAVLPLFGIASRTQVA